MGRFHDGVQHIRSPHDRSNIPEQGKDYGKANDSARNSLPAPAKKIYNHIYILIKIYFFILERKEVDFPFYSYI